MKTSWKTTLVIVSIFSSMAFSSCSQDDDPQPAKKAVTKSIKKPTTTSTEGQDPIPDPKG